MVVAVVMGAGGYLGGWFGDSGGVGGVARGDGGRALYQSGL